MRTCNNCHLQFPDTTLVCPNCETDLVSDSVRAAQVQELIDNPRVKSVRLIVARDACPACQAQQGTYAKDAVPALPVHGCSGPDGCRCSYEPLFTEVRP
ncbi:MAG TPA: hypothetical protein PKD55_18970 [Bellilinea sp.]|nr:hypothetical protein [Bellilinea sp.]